MTFNRGKENNLDENLSEFDYPEWMLERFKQFIPNYKDMLKRIENKYQKYIRVNTIKINSFHLYDLLKDKGIQLEKTSLSYVFKVKNSSNIGSTIEYLSGFYYIQDISSCFAVEAMDLAKNQMVLDMCSAPGGKTTLIAQKMSNTGIIIALEPNKSRLNALTFNLSRCGIYNTCILNIKGEDFKTDIGFDKILLDAPCSCEGIIFKDPRRKNSHSLSDIKECSNKQKTLLEAALNLLKPNGTIIYSTCSFAPEENECVIDELYNNQKYNFSIEPLDFGLEGLQAYSKKVFTKDMKNARRFYPHIHDTIGFFIAKLRKHG